VLAEIKRKERALSKKQINKNPKNQIWQTYSISFHFLFNHKQQLTSPPSVFKSTLFKVTKMFLIEHAHTDKYIKHIGNIEKLALVIVPQRGAKHTINTILKKNPSF